MDLSCVIPARVNSSRFPKKLLHPIKGKALIFHTVSRAIEANCFNEIVCMTDSVEISQALKGLGVRIIITGSALNGTERIAQYCHLLKSELIVNLQGDEPFFPVEELTSFSKNLNPALCEVQILVHRNPTPDILKNPNRVKVILDPKDYVLDYKREISSTSSPDQIGKPATQAGIYGYTKNFLHKYLKAGPSKREIEESHEMLRIWPLPRTLARWAKKQSQSVDVVEDLTKIV